MAVSRQAVCDLLQPSIDRIAKGYTLVPNKENIDLVSPDGTAEQLISASDIADNSYKSEYVLRVKSRMANTI